MANDGARVFGRRRDRPVPSFADALCTGGALIVGIGVLLVALDVSGEGEDGWKGALCFVALAAIATVALPFAPRALRPACVTLVALSIPAIYGFLLLPDADGFGVIRGFLILTIATWTLFFLFTGSRGRPILLALIAIALYLWVLGEVTDSDAFFAAPVPSPPVSSPAELIDGIRGEPQVIATTVAGRPAQEIGLDDLDASDPLYPVAEDCAAGDFDACDELWTSSEIDSDFETFAESCGGDPSRTYPCSDTANEDPFDEGPFFDEDPNGDSFDELDGFGDGEVFVDPGVTFEPSADALEIGLVSLAFGALYLAALVVLDRRRYEALGTAFVVPAVGTLLVAASSLGAETESAIAGGLITFAFGVAIGIVGYLGGRRFTAWVGGAIASVGALIIAVDVAPEGDGVDPDLLGPGFVLLAFGVAIIAAAWLARHLLETDPPDSSDTPDPADPPPTSLDDPPPAVDTWAPPPGRPGTP